MGRYGFTSALKGACLQGEVVAGRCLKPARCNYVATPRGLPTEVELGPEDGMPRLCVLNADHTATIAKGYLRESITTVGSESSRVARLAISGPRGVRTFGAA